MAMLDEEEIRPKPQLVARPPLDGFSVDDLRAYIEALRTEISRAETAITVKQASRNHADSFFRPPG